MFAAGEARPMLIAAEKSLKALNRNDITEVKAMKRPPVGVLLVIEAICIINNVKPIKVRRCLRKRKRERNVRWLEYRDANSAIYLKYRARSIKFGKFGTPRDTIDASRSGRKLRYSKNSL